MELAFGHHAGRVYLASIDNGNVLQLWDGADGTPLTTVSMKGRRGSNLSLLSIGGRLIASVTGDRWRGLLVDLVSGRKTAKDEFDEHPITFLNGRPVTITAAPDGDLQTSEAQIATAINRLPGVASPAAASSGVASPAAALLGAALSGAVSSGAVSGAKGSSPDAMGFGAAGANGSAVERSVTCFHAGGRLMAAVIHAHEVSVWDVAAHRIVDVVRLEAPVAGLAATESGDLLALAGGKGVFLAHSPSGQPPQPEAVP
ncbi:hypothetical protein [Actinoplanes sp. CA-252034]|uniref:hypothetical protein n=1 Tax=Actinoplanes sp. CA-252034 TaxID=3239906 RepID=UPI003D975E91